MKKKLVSLFLALALCLGLCPAAFAAEGFQDVPEDAWFYGNVMKAAELGLMQGKGNGNFKPADLMTRAEAVTLAARLYQQFASDAPDIPARQAGEPWYGPYFRYLSLIGIMDGPMDDALNESVTREGYVNLFYQTLHDFLGEPVNDIPDGSIPDVPVGQGASEAIYAFYRAGILTGSDAHGYFNPESYIFRSEVATILVRLVDESARKHFALSAGGLEGLRAACAAGGNACAVAFLDTDFDDESTLTAYWNDLDFLYEIAYVEQPGNEYYLIIPADSKASVLISEWIIDDDNIDGRQGDALLTGEPGQSVVVRCNVSDIIPNARIFIVSEEGELLLEFSPSLSLKDGNLQPVEGVYDYTRYGEG